MLSLPGSDIMNAIFLLDGALLLIPCRKVHPDMNSKLARDNAFEPRCEEGLLWLSHLPFLNTVEYCSHAEDAVESYDATPRRAEAARGPGEAPVEADREGGTRAGVPEGDKRGQSGHTYRLDPSQALAYIDSWLISVVDEDLSTLAFVEVERSHNSSTQQNKTALRHPAHEEVGIKVSNLRTLVLVNDRPGTILLSVIGIVPEIEYELHAVLRRGNDLMSDTWQLLSAPHGKEAADFNLSLPGLPLSEAPYTLQVRLYEFPAVPPDAREEGEKEEEEEELRAVFDELDVDKSGKISEVEFARYHTGLPRLQLRDKFVKADTDKSEAVDFEEFVALHEERGGILAYVGQKVHVTAADDFAATMEKRLNTLSDSENRKQPHLDYRHLLVMLQLEGGDREEFGGDFDFLLRGCDSTGSSASGVLLQLTLQNIANCSGHGERGSCGVKGGRMEITESNNIIDWSAHPLHTLNTACAQENRDFSPLFLGGGDNGLVYPIPELALMAGAMVRAVAPFKAALQQSHAVLGSPSKNQKQKLVVFEWGTNIGVSARIFVDFALQMNLDVVIHSTDLPETFSPPGALRNVSFSQTIGDRRRGRLVRHDRFARLVTLHEGDGLTTSLGILEKLELTHKVPVIWFVDGDHSEDAVIRELDTIISLPHCAHGHCHILVHDSFSADSGPFRAIESIQQKMGDAEERFGATVMKFGLLHSRLAPAGMSLLYPRS